MTTSVRRLGPPALALMAGLCLFQAPADTAAESADFQPVVVKPGDTLWAIANTWLKDPARWDEILKHNTQLPSRDPTVALPGMTLRVPVRLIKEDLRAAFLVHRRNDVLYRRKETADWKAAREKMDLYRDDVIRTLEDSVARVNFVDQGTLQVDENSMAIIRPGQKDTDVDLRSGGVFVGRARVTTASARIIPKTPDTKYSARVRQDLSTLVEVFKGKAEVEAEGKKVEVAEGFRTQVRLAQAPEAPRRIPNLPEFYARAAEFEGNLGPVRARAGLTSAAPGPGSAPGAELTAAARIEDIRVEVERIKIGEPISGYRVQFSRDPDFARSVFDRVYEADIPVRAQDIQIAPGRYWVRIAPVDLLGTQGKFRAAKLYILGASTLTAVREYKSGVLLIRPAQDEVVFQPLFRVIGRARAGLSLMVNGRAVRVDGENNFSSVVTLSPGENAVRVTTIDAEGNTDFIQRFVTYQPSR